MREQAPQPFSVSILERIGCEKTVYDKFRVTFRIADGINH